MNLGGSNTIDNIMISLSRIKADIADYQLISIKKAEPFLTLPLTINIVMS
jgi:hypothetical protein